MTGKDEAPICNIAAHLAKMARLQPDALAVVLPTGADAQGQRSYERQTYAELDRQSDLIAAGLTKIGIRRGMRTVLMVKPGPHFFGITFALFKAGIVPVLIDPGLGIAQLKTCIAQVEPEAFIGIRAAHLARVLLGLGRKTVRICVAVGPRWPGGGIPLTKVIAAGEGTGPVLAPTRADETAAILFTSGSTGVAKGVRYSHGNFAAQIDLIRATYDIRPGEIDLPTFPLFALFDPALGMTTVVPDMDFTRPAKVDPVKIRQAIEDWGVTNVFASPALLATVSAHGAANGVQWLTVRRALSAGAPVPAATLERLQGMLAADAQVFTPYGATEALPVASIGSREILEETRRLTESGAGVCVGRVIRPNDVRIIEITDTPLGDWSQVRELAVGQVGEITVSGPTTTSYYVGRPEATQAAKIMRDGLTVHRMGDLGYFDAEGRLWFCGRMSQRVELDDAVLFSTQVEEIFNTHPAVLRTALVGSIVAQHRVPVLCVELKRGPGRWRAGRRVIADLKLLGARHEHTKGIAHFLIHRDFPVDIRHNAKIGREILTRWAQAKLS